MFKNARISLVVGLFGSSFATASPSPSVVPQSVLSRAAEAGITAETLAASGATAPVATVLLHRLADAGGAAAALDAALAAADAAAAALTAAQDALAAEPGDAALAAARDGAQAVYASAALAAESARVALRLEALGEDAAIYAAPLAVQWSAASRTVPTAFKAVERSAEQWDAIERALRAEARSQRLGAPLDAAHASLLASIRAEPAVVQAQAGLTESLAAIGVAFVPTS